MTPLSDTERNALSGAASEYIAALEAEHIRLVEALALPESERYEFVRDTGDGCWRMEIQSQHWAIRAIVESLADSLDDADNLGDACNLITMTVGPVPKGDKLIGPFEVTVRRIPGKTVAQVLDELRGRIADLEDTVLACLVAAGAPEDLAESEQVVKAAGDKPSDFIRATVQSLQDRIADLDAALQAEIDRIESLEAAVHFKGFAEIDFAAQLSATKVRLRAAMSGPESVSPATY